jgi:hypothetical protein
MAIKSAWAKRNADRMLAESLATVAQHKAANAPAVPTAAQLQARIDLRDELFNKVWDALTVGSNLAIFGINGSVGKKNPKSVVTEFSDCRWTRQELRNLFA